MIKIYNHHKAVIENPPGANEVFIYRDDPEKQYGEFPWCVAETRSENDEVQVRDVGCFADRTNAIAFAVVYADPALIQLASDKAKQQSDL